MIKKPFKHQSLAEKIEVFEAYKPGFPEDQKALYSEDRRKSMTLNNMFDFHLKKRSIDEIKNETNNENSKNQNIIFSVKCFNVKMKENLENLEGYFQTFDKILDNKIYSKLVPMVRRMGMFILI